MTEKNEKNMFLRFILWLFVPATLYAFILLPLSLSLYGNVEYEYSLWAALCNQLTFFPDLLMRLSAAVYLVRNERIGGAGKKRMVVCCLAASLYRLIAAEIMGAAMTGGPDLSDVWYDCLILLLSFLLENLYLPAVLLFARKTSGGKILPWSLAVAICIFGIKILSALRYDFAVGMPVGREWLQVIWLYLSLVGCGILTVWLLPRWEQSLSKRYLI